MILELDVVKVPLKCFIAIGKCFLFARSKCLQGWEKGYVGEVIQYVWKAISGCEPWSVECGNGRCLIHFMTISGKYFHLQLCGLFNKLQKTIIVTKNMELCHASITW